MTDEKYTLNPNAVSPGWKDTQVHKYCVMFEATMGDLTLS